MNPFRPSAPLQVSAAGKGGNSGRSRRRNGMLLVAFFVILLDGVSPAPSRGADPVSPEALVASLPRGDAFANDGEPYVWLPTLRAAKETGGRSLLSAGDASAAEGEGALSAGEILDRKGLFTIYRPAVDGVSPAPGVRVLQESSGDLPAHPVVFNQRTKALGVLTRNLWLKLKEMGDTEAIAGEYGLILSFSNPAMQTSFYRAPEGIDLKRLRERLQNDPRILGVTLEIIDRVHRPR